MNRTIWIVAASVLALCALLLLWEDDPYAEITARDSTGQTEGNYLMLAASEPDTVDPQCTSEYYTVALNVFDRLVEVRANPDGSSELVLSLAESWEVSDDGYVYTFYLRRGVTFSNGSPLTASDVGYTLARLLTHPDSCNQDIASGIFGAEALASGRQLANKLLIASILIMTAFGSVSALLMKRLIMPLQNLTDAAEHLEQGEYDIRLSYDRDDEIGTLTRTFQQLVDHLKVYISDLNSKAYQDAMTGVRNKGAFNVSARKLDEELQAGTEGAAEFAIIMFDCNNLKVINDTCGHEKGDFYLRRACKLICSVFLHSPVFRVGGDEFTAILQGEAYRERNALLARFDEGAREINEQAREPWEFVRIAKGMAAYDPSQDQSAEDVLKRADDLMYEDKRRSKAARR